MSRSAIFIADKNYSAIGKEKLLTMLCEHGFPLSKMTNKCMCKNMNYWKGCDTGVSSATSENFPLRERRLFDVNNSSACGTFKSFKELELEAYLAISKLYLPPEVLNEWFGPQGRLTNWNSDRKVPDMPAACARENATREKIPNINAPVQLSEPDSEVHVQPASKKSVSFAEIPSPQVSVRPKTSQVRCEGGATSMLRKVVPTPCRVAFLGDSTLSCDNVSSIVQDDMLIMSTGSHHNMPPVRVLNLCDQFNSVGIQELLHDTDTIMQWASYKPRVTVLAVGTYDLISGGLCPIRRALWMEVTRFCLQIQEEARDNMNRLLGAEFDKLMDKHQFILMPPLDFLEFKKKPGLLECHEYVDIRSNAEKGLLMNRALIYNQARIVMCFNKVKSVGYKLNESNQLRYNDKISHCIARLVCRRCGMEDYISHNEHSNLMRNGCAHPGRSQSFTKKH